MSWWRSAVLYQVYPRSYGDTDGDGTGDLPGVTAHLDHLRWLGVDAVWLSPFYPSPMADFGYDITDHTGVDPLFGSLASFEALVGAAHARGLRVLLDFVPAHTSDRHPWFAASRSARDDPRRDWYLWADPAPGGGPPNNWRSVFGGPAWTLDERTGQYYEHAHLAAQPSLNWRNPAVRAAQLDVLRTWVARGADGFRVDALRHVVKDDRLRDNPPNPAWREGRSPYEELLPVWTTDRPEVQDVVRELRAAVGDRLLVGELYVPLERLVPYHASGMEMPSNMHLISTPWRAAEVAALVERYEGLLPAGAWPNWVLGNHDRSRVASRVGPDQARVAAVLLLTLRGTPTVYYGDELGTADVPIAPAQVRDPYGRQVPGFGRDPVRTPMRWTAGPGGGFCPPDVTPWLPLAPVAPVDAQAADPASMLDLHRRLIALRRSFALAGYRTLHVDDAVFAYRRGDVAVALNFGAEPRPAPVRGRLLLSTVDRPDPATLAPAEGRVVAGRTGAAAPPVRPAGRAGGAPA